MFSTRQRNDLYRVTSHGKTFVMQRCHAGESHGKKAFAVSIIAELLPCGDRTAKTLPCIYLFSRSEGAMIMPGRVDSGKESNQAFMSSTYSHTGTPGLYT
jgi:hypothetical protein